MLGRVHDGIEYLSQVDRGRSQTRNVLDADTCQYLVGARKLTLMDWFRPKPTQDKRRQPQWVIFFIALFVLGVLVWFAPDLIL